MRLSQQADGEIVGAELEVDAIASPDRSQEQLTIRLHAAGLRLALTLSTAEALVLSARLRKGVAYLSEHHAHHDLGVTVRI